MSFEPALELSTTLSTAFSALSGRRRSSASSSVVSEQHSETSAFHRFGSSTQPKSPKHSIVPSATSEARSSQRNPHSDSRKNSAVQKKRYVAGKSDMSRSLLYNDHSQKPQQIDLLTDSEEEPSMQESAAKSEIDASLRMPEVSQPSVLHNTSDDDYYYAAGNTRDSGTFADSLKKPRSKRQTRKDRVSRRNGNAKLKEDRKNYHSTDPSLLRNDSFLDKSRELDGFEEFDGNLDYARRYGDGPRQRRCLFGVCLLWTDVVDWTVLCSLIAIELYMTTWMNTKYNRCIPEESHKCNDTKDPSMNYPYRISAVSNSLNWLICFLLCVNVVGLSLMAVGCLYRGTINGNTLNWKSLAMMFHVSLKQFIAAAVLTDLFGNGLKYTTGRPRPNYWALQDRSNHKDQARLAFPSLHVGFAFSIMVSMLLYLMESYQMMNERRMRNRDELWLKQRMMMMVVTEKNSSNRRNGRNNRNNEREKEKGRMMEMQERWMRERRDFCSERMSDSMSVFEGMFCGVLWQSMIESSVRSPVLASLLVSLPLLYACFIGTTRVNSYWHHFDDCIAGAILGTLFACVTYASFRTDLKYFQRTSLVITESTQSMREIKIVSGKI